MKGIVIESITKSYDNNKNVIEDFNLKIQPGEFVVLLGPSGCGKSTLLRIIAGLEEIDQGKIYIDSEDITEKEPKDRNIAMVFQNYALYPHMTVYKNIAIGLMLKKEDKSYIDERVHEVAKMLDIQDLLDRKPRQLSGGQMQRVALARAMIRKPKAFLMDEPLSNLDSKLRVQTRAEIMKLYKQLGVTTIYVTHDQVEAMTMATTIVLMKDGVIQQKGSPGQLYNHPNNVFVAEFIGTPQMNLLEGRIFREELEVLGERWGCSGQDAEVTVGIRPEHVTLVEGDDFSVEMVENLGSEKLVYLKSVHREGVELAARTSVANTIRVGDRCGVQWDADHFHLFEKSTGDRIDGWEKRRETLQ